MIKLKKYYNINLIICLCVRNCSLYLENVISNIENIRFLFNKSKVIFVESDSSDTTVNLIEQYQEENENIELISHGNLRDTFPGRPDRIAYCRNSYLDIVEKYKDEYEYLLILDGDSASSENISNESIISNFEIEDWDMITANQPEGYYDIWALRHEELMPFDCWKEFSKDPTKESFDYFIKSRFAKINLNDNLIPVKSAFGGAGFIRSASIKGARHVGHTEDGIQVCEWVPFCNLLNEGKAKIFINPKFVNSTELSDHIKNNLVFPGVWKGDHLKPYIENKKNIL